MAPPSSLDRDHSCDTSCERACIVCDEACRPCQRPETWSVVVRASAPRRGPSSVSPQKKKQGAGRWGQAADLRPLAAARYRWDIIDEPHISQSVPIRSLGLGPARALSSVIASRISPPYPCHCRRKSCKAEHPDEMRRCSARVQASTASGGSSDSLSKHSQPGAWPGLAAWTSLVPCFSIVASPACYLTRAIVLLPLPIATEPKCRARAHDG
jgi:hypothetical protein